MPFDLRMKRVLTYEMSEATKERAPVRKTLEVQLEENMRTIFVEIKKTHREITVFDETREAIENGNPNQRAKIHRL